MQCMIEMHAEGIALYMNFMHMHETYGGVAPDLIFVILEGIMM